MITHSDPQVFLKSCTPEPVALIAEAARVCYRAEATKSDEDLVKMLLWKQHLSPLEHASATFGIRCNRGVSHELVRHRIAAYSQESTRYCDYNKDKFDGQISVLRPYGMTMAQQEIWKKYAALAEEGYQAMRKAGAAPQIARDLLPICTSVTIVATMNFRQWLHVIMQRSSPKAHPQIQHVAQQICALLHVVAPCIFPQKWDPVPAI